VSTGEPRAPRPPVLCGYSTLGHRRRTRSGDHTGTTRARHFTAYTAGTNRMVEPNPDGSEALSVAGRKPPGCRLDAGRILGNDGSRRDDPPGQLRMAARIGPVNQSRIRAQRPYVRLYPRLSARFPREKRPAPAWLRGGWSDVRDRLMTSGGHFPNLVCDLPCLRLGQPR
jgi:hypothetical protein